VSYAVTILRRAQKELAALPTDSYTRVRDAIYALAETQDHPAVSSCQVGKDGGSASALTESFTRLTTRNKL